MFANLRGSPDRERPGGAQPGRNFGIGAVGRVQDQRLIKMFSQSFEQLEDVSQVLV